MCFSGFCPQTREPFKIVDLSLYSIYCVLISGSLGDIIPVAGDRLSLVVHFREYLSHSLQVKLNISYVETFSLVRHADNLHILVYNRKKGL